MVNKIEKLGTQLENRTDYKLFGQTTNYMYNEKMFYTFNLFLYTLHNIYTI